MTLIGGQLLALLVVVVLQHTMEDAALREWGWRIPFALGAVLAVVALWLRRQLDETSQQETRALKEAGSLKGLWRNRRAFIMVLGFTAAGSLCFYTFTTYMQKYLVNTAGMHANVASGIMTAALFVFMLIQPLMARCRIRLVAVPQCYVSVRWQPFLPFLFSQHCKTFPRLMPLLVW